MLIKPNAADAAATAKLLNDLRNDIGGTSPVTVATVSTVAPIAKPAALIGGYTARNVSKASLTIRAMRTSFSGTVSPRDASYMLSFGDALTRTVGDIVALATLASAGSNVHGGAYGSVSNKPHDAGACVRAIKAGHIAINNPSTVAEIEYTPTGERSTVDASNAQSEISFRVTKRGAEFLAKLREASAS